MAYKRNGEKVEINNSFSFHIIYESFIYRFMTETELVLYCDFHGHSRKQNVFIYGCENKHLPGQRLKERIFPAMLAKNDPSKVSFAVLSIMKIIFIDF